MANVLSFSLTPQEAERLKYYTQTGRYLEPRGAADLAMIIVISTAYFVELLATIFMLWNRSYLPIKAKNPILMALVFVASVLWFAGNLQINGHVPLKDTQLEQCKAIGVWMHILMGVCSVSSLIGFRSFGLYQIFCRNRPYRGPALLISVILTITCMLVFGIITEALPDDLSVKYLEHIDICGFALGYRIGMFALIWVTWIIVALLNWRIRNIKSSFNESREITVACIIVFAVLIFMTVLSIAQPRYTAYRALRITATLLNHFAATTIWWLMMAVPLYNCLTNRETYLKQWIYKLRQDGLQRAYHIDAGASKGNSLSSSDHPYNKHHEPESRRHSVHAQIHDKDIGYANPNGEFYYGANNEATISEVLAKVCPNAMGGTPCNRSGEGNGGIHLSSSASSLVMHRPPMSAGCGGMSQAVYSSENSSEANSPHRVQSPAAAAAKRPWDKLASAVGRLGGQPTSPGLKSPIPSPTTARPYIPTSSFPDPAAASQLRLDAAQDSRLNDSYTSDDRRIL
ncbi:hypothetical protein H4218_005378 [Coemansia sp. IMI 209128]|nr:hypothetical protein GGI10_002640 [Coemansia sp. RSA 2530]KAJ2695008.1 hypothetical protein H4218_005378 [Coemansia sp. IMI 209128]